MLDSVKNGVSFVFLKELQEFIFFIFVSNKFQTSVPFARKGMFHIIGSFIPLMKFVRVSCVMLIDLILLNLWVRLSKTPSQGCLVSIQ